MGTGDENDCYTPQKMTTFPKEIGKIVRVSCGGSHVILNDDKNQI